MNNIKKIMDKQKDMFNIKKLREKAKKELTMRYQVKALTLSDKPEWVEGYLLKSVGVYTRVFNCEVKNGEVYDNYYLVIPTTVCKCTGLKLHDNFLYEYDVVTHPNTNCEYVVLYNNTSCKFVLAVIHPDENHITIDFDDVVNLHEYKITKNLMDHMTIEDYITNKP